MVLILDCTLRDGGYINNWNFSEQFVKNLYLGLVNIVDYIEIGFCDNLQIYKNKYTNLY